MTTASPNEAMALMRDVMDKALASENGVRLTFLDEKYGTRAASREEARRWQGRMYTARSSMRKVQARIERDADVSLLALSGSAVAPDAFRTAYDTLYAGVDRNADDTGWWVTVRKVDASALGLEIL